MTTKSWLTDIESKMTKPLAFLSETPDIGLSESTRQTPMDILSSLLHTIRLSGRVQYHHTFSAPFCIESPTPTELAYLLQSGHKQIVSFHIVADGSGWVSLSGENKMQQIIEGDILVIPSSTPHILSDKPDQPVVRAIELLPPPPWPELLVLQYGGGGSITQLVCGFLLCEELLMHPFFNTLPPLMHISTVDETTSPLLTSGVQYIVEETTKNRPGSESVLARLTELMFLEILRGHMQRLPKEKIGWLSALNDPIVGPVLELIHSRPEHNWQVPELAEKVSVSRSLLADRFSHILGLPPKKYIAQWRLQLALNLLRSSTYSVSQIASKVGYESEYAFNRVFKRHIGLPPATWRRSQLGSTASGPFGHLINS